MPPLVPVLVQYCLEACAHTQVDWQVLGGGAHLKQLESGLDIKIPNVQEASAPFLTIDDALYGDRLVNTHQDPRSVEDEEHNDSDYENDGQVAVLLLLVHPVSLSQ